MLRFSLQANRDMSINDLQIALINYIVAQQKNSLFFIRTKEDESLEDREQEWIDILKKFAINTENIINQSKNLNIYQHLASSLIKEGRAFACFCNSKECQENCSNLSQEEIAKEVKNGKKYTIRVNAPKSPISYKDTIYGDVTIEAKDIGSFVILSQDGKPSVDFATAVDDMSSGISTIIEAQEYLKNSAKQLYIHKLLGYEADIEYAHIPELLEDKFSIKSLLKKGFLPDAIINLALKLAGFKKEDIFYLPEVIEDFDLSKVSKKSATFNIEELKDINKKHLLAMDSKKLSKIFGFADSDIGELLKLFLDKKSTIKELDEIIVAIFSAKECSQDMQELVQIIKKAPMLYSFEEFKNYLFKNSSLSSDRVLKALSMLILGEEDIEKLDKIYPYINPYILEVVKCR